MLGIGDREAARADDDLDMDAQVDDGSFETTMETEMDGAASPFKKRRNTWPGSLLTMKVHKVSEELDDTEEEKPATNMEETSPAARKMSTRRNAWGNMSYAEMITSAIESTPEKRMTLGQIYDWIVKNVPYFQDKGDNSSSASWKNSIRHNLSLHSQFTKMQNEGTGKSSWWVVNPDAAIQRRRARTMESGVFDRKRGKSRLKMLGSAPVTISTIDENQSEPGTRHRSGSSASSLGRLSPFQVEAEMESMADEPYRSGSQTPQSLTPGQNDAPQFLVSGSKGNLVSVTSPQFPAPGTAWQNFTITLKDSPPLVVAPMPTTVVFMDRPVQNVAASMLPINGGAVSQQAPMIVLLTYPQTALPQFVQPSGSCVTVPLSLPSNTVSCGTLSEAHDVQNACEASIAVASRPQQSSVSMFQSNSDSPVAIRNVPVPSFQTQDVNSSSSVDSVPKSQSVSQHYLQFLNLLSSKQMRDYMTLRPDFSEKFRRLLLAKREKMLQEMNEQKSNDSESIEHRSFFGSEVRLSSDRKLRGILKQNEMHLEKSMNLISLNSGSSTTHPLSCVSETQPDDLLEMLDLNIEQVVNQDLEQDLLLDLNFNSFVGELGCDDDFLNQF